MKRRTFLTVLAAGHLAACSRPTSSTLSGVTMGTSYSVTVPEVLSEVQSTSLRTAIDSTLKSIVAAMSTYDRYSELSQFNDSMATKWQPVSPELFTVLEAASRAGRFSKGAFDVTVGPLVDLWGFGPDLRSGARPRSDAFARARARVSRHHLRLNLQTRLVRKQRADVQVDLSSIAKGYGVDRVAELLEARGVSDYLVEIGGEIRVRGASAAQRPWRVAVEAPQASHHRIAKVLELKRGGVATSGNYRDFFDLGQRRYPHVIDPRSGEPVEHPPLSVTVISESAMQADALATALLVMGPDAGYRFASTQGLAALFITLAGSSGGEIGERLHSRSTGPMQELLAR